ncbi:methylthioadenosine phosphorylase [Candidatus Marsarchaeota G1 archaeon OSP_C]|uniref:S-methyl-5'-thioadenosine phosphorylase n=1 Tax=Candidatus Marsarchaeota G1 archaeon OSP_C TaxID=1978154 RepID=A0A2R6ASL2_9ARCH|nr:MAG: methylthioadenosine phosphorylase [Candidatus Marsarchaeota G1 archaeon OSP_C]
MNFVSEQAQIGIIGGSGFYDPSLLKNTREIRVHTPYGPPSDSIWVGELQDTKVAFIPRHGRNHTIPPHKINSRANIWALNSLGVTRIVAPSAVGSLKTEIEPGDIVFPDQFIDMTKQRVYTFYDGPRVVHISMADPFCKEERGVLAQSAKSLGIKHHETGTYLCIEGPRFSTRAESALWRLMNADVIGMTLVPEINLARELGMCYSTIALVTDYDVWAEHPVTAKQVVETQKRNIENAKRILYDALPKLKSRACDCKKALEEAFV